MTPDGKWVSLSIVWHFIKKEDYNLTSVRSWWRLGFGCWMCPRCNSPWKSIYCFHIVGPCRRRKTKMLQDVYSSLIYHHFVIIIMVEPFIPSKSGWSHNWIWELFSMSNFLPNAHQIATFNFWLQQWVLTIWNVKI